jgi:hypothetical protein
MILRLRLILFLILLASSVAQAKHHVTRSQSAKQLNVEQAADHVMLRFYETLDFKTIYDEMYVADPFKSTEVRWTIRGIVWQSTAASRPPTVRKRLLIDFPAMERAYIARQNFLFLRSAVKFTHDKTAEDEFKAQFEELYQRLIKERSTPILTSNDLDKAFTARLNQLNDLLRKYVVKTDFNSSRYKAAAASIEESRAEESSRLKDLFQLKRQQPIFIVRRENHYLYFIENGGQLRMLSSTPRIQD